MDAEEVLEGAYRIRLPHSQDPRGSFVKTFNETLFSSKNIHFEMKESFVSFSHQRVLRGMHFQTPPFSHSKLVHCLAGKAMDVLLDLRSGKNYGRFIALHLNAETPECVFIPPGIAHGFLAEENHTVMLYYTDTEYSPSHDTGIRWDSFGFDWNVVFSPITSTRDQNFPPFNDFISPF